MFGYMHHDYAESLSEFGTPRELYRCGGWVLDRPIVGTPFYDAMGCYPLFTCTDWSQLHADLNDISDELVSISLVTDPFGEYDISYLKQCFTDVVISFKQHFIVDLSHSLSEFISKHHARYARQALSQLYIEKCEEPERLIYDWVSLYNNLIQRHSIKGITAFSGAALARQLSVPGIVVFRAVHNERTVGMVVWYVQKERCYYHLGAYSSEGYRLRASFALFRVAMEHFAANGVRWIDLGAGAGLRSNGTDGLSQFKQGWSTGTRTAYFCGRIFNRQRYMEIVRDREIFTEDFFPAYRKGEFA